MPIHPTAVIDPSADIDPSARIGPHVVIDGPAKIGPQAVIDPFVFITGFTTIGANCRLHSGAVVGDFPQDVSFSGEESYCVIGADTIIREGVTIHRGAKPGSATVVGKRCLLMANSHVAHDCTLEDDVMLTNGALLGGYVFVGRRAFISGNAGVHQFVRIGEIAMISGLAKVTQDIPPYFMTDRDGQCIGVNRIGMKRAGLAAEEFDDVRRAFRLLYRTTGKMSETIDTLEQSCATDAGRRLIEFLQEPSSRGIAGPSKGERADILRDESLAENGTAIVHDVT